MNARQVCFVTSCGFIGALALACSGQDEGPDVQFLAATEVVDAIIVRHYDDGGTSLDVRGMFKGESVPKTLRGIRHTESASGRMGEPARELLGEGERYLILVFDHYFVDSTAVYRLREQGAEVLCECPDGRKRRWLPLSDFIDSMRGSGLPQ